MSANESTPAVSLREARQREALVVTHAVNVQHNPRATATAFNSASERAVAARRATDEALVRAVVFHLYCGRPSERWHDYLTEPSLLLDAVEREEAGR